MYAKELAFHPYSGRGKPDQTMSTASNPILEAIDPRPRYVQKQDIRETGKKSKSVSPFPSLLRRQFL